jgi:hypothetical protein
MTQSEKGSLGPLATQVIALNLRYYRALGEATVDYVRSVVGFLGEHAPLVRNVVTRARQAATPVASTSATGATEMPAEPAAAVILEAAAGEEAAGGFLINNRLSRRVSAAFRISPISGPDGEPYGGKLSVEPAVVTLDAGMQNVVRIATTIPRSLAPAADYRGTISLPGLADAPIDVVIRRRAEPADAPTAAAPRRASTKRRSKPTATPASRAPRGRR